MTGKNDLAHLLENIRSSKKYQTIDVKLIERIGQTELSKRRNLKEAIKATRSKLHQVTTSFVPSPLDFSKWSEKLKSVGGQLTNPSLQDFCLEMMKCHSSTDERLPILKDFYLTIFKTLPPIKSILDLACGLNPLALPWMPVAKGCAYYAFDILPNMMEFLNHFFAHVGQNGKAITLDLSLEMPDQSVDLALLLKTLPTLQQIDRHRVPFLLEKLRARNLVVSYPVHSLGGKPKGMAENYESHFHTLTADWQGTIQRFDFTTELAFLLTREETD